MTDLSCTRLGIPQRCPDSAGDTPLPGTRAWFALFLLWTGGLAALALAALSRYERLGDAASMRIWLLALMCFYLTLCNSLLPLPTAWIVLLAASPGYQPLTPAPLGVMVVAGLATVATIMANLNEYHLLACLLRLGLGRRIRSSRLYAWTVRWFERSPFRLLTLLAFLPIPLDAIRWLAIVRGYPRVRFALAYLVGRGPRYLLLAACAACLALTTGQILWIQLAIVAAAVAVRLAWRAVAAQRLARQRA